MSRCYEFTFQCENDIVTRRGYGNTIHSAERGARSKLPADERRTAYTIGAARFIPKSER